MTGEQRYGDICPICGLEICICNPKMFGNDKVDIKHLTESKDNPELEYYKALKVASEEEKKAYLVYSKAQKKYMDLLNRMTISYDSYSCSRYLDGKLL